MSQKDQVSIGDLVVLASKEGREDQIIAFRPYETYKKISIEHSIKLFPLGTLAVVIDMPEVSHPERQGLISLALVLIGNEKFYIMDENLDVCVA